MSPSLERDRCLHDQIKQLDAAQASQVLAKAKQIQDPMVRGAAVSRWVADHAGQMPPGLGQELCALLRGRDVGYCQRRLSSPHLQR